MRPPAKWVGDQNPLGGSNPPVSARQRIHFLYGEGFSPISYPAKVGNDFDTNLVLSRLTYGPEQSLRNQLVQKGLKNWLSEQLASNAEESHPLLQAGTAFLSNQLSLREVATHPNFRRRTERVAQEVASLTMLRRLYSDHQVRETLVEFISDYVPVPLFSSGEWARMDYDRTIRNMIGGTYPDLLVSLSFHPAMLFYLNGQTNTAKSPNENFGRELLELFTVTPKAQYTESDVVGASQMLSGISFSLLEYRTKAAPSLHHFGRIKVLGFTHPNAPTDSEDTILSRASQMILHLAKLPQTARAFSLRMATRFLSDRPPSDVLRAMEKSYLASGGSIFQTLQALVLHPRFLSTPASKVKRPAEHFSSTIRALALQPTVKRPSGGWLDSDALNPMLAVLKRQGHLPFDWETPDGFPDQSIAWATFGGQVQRWNLSARLSQGGYANIFNNSEYEKQFVDWLTLEELLSKISMSLLSQPLREVDAAHMVRLLKANEPRNLPEGPRKARMVQLAMALVMATEEWNVR